MRRKDLYKRAARPFSAALAGILLTLSIPGVVEAAPEKEKALVEAGSGNQLYVSLDGDDTADGTLEHPFRTLEAARDKIREMKAEGMDTGGITVNIRGGEYALLGDTFSLDEQDSGTAGNPITWRAYEGEEVKFVGNIQVEGNKFSPIEEQSVKDRLPEGVKDQVLVYDLAKENGLTEFAPIPKNGYGWPAQANAMSVLVDGDAQTLSRFPNEGFIDIFSIQEKGFVPRDHLANPDGSCPECTKDAGGSERIPCKYGESKFLEQKGGVFTTDNAEVLAKFPLWSQETDIWTFGYFYWDWADDNCAIESVKQTDAGVQMTMRHPSRYGVGQGGRRFYAYNMLCEVDQPGEWYLDRDNGKLYLYPEKDISGSSIELSMQTKPLVTMEDVDYVNWQGVSFTKSNGHGMVMKNCENVEVAGCIFSDLGQRAVFVGDPNYTDADIDLGASGGSNNTIRSCDITRTGQGGILLGGGNRYKLTPGNNKVVNCDISDFSTIKRTYSPAVELVGCGNSAERNHIYNAPHTAIQFKGNDMNIFGNDIHNVCYETADVGAIYSVRRWSWQGNVIQNNFVHDLVSTGGIGSAAVYVDDLGSGVTMTENLFVNIPGYTTLFGGGRDHVITNNIQINNGDGKGFQYDDRGLGWAWYHAAGPDGECYGELTTLRANPEYDKALWDKKYPGLANIDLDTVEERTDKGDGYKNWYKVAAQPANSTIEKNILVGVANPYGNVSDNTRKYSKFDKKTNESHPQGTEIGFTNVDAYDFTVLENSRIKEMMGDKHFKVEEMGLYEDEFRTLTKIELKKPELIAPTDGEQDIVTTNGVKLSWNAVENAGTYHVEIASDEAFKEPVKTVATDHTSVSVKGLEKSKTYYWKVTAREKKVNGAYSVSDVRSFTTSEKDDGSFFEGFRDFEEWEGDNPSTTTEYAHSGRYSFELNDSQDRVRKELGSNHNDVMSVWLYDNLNKENGAAAVADVTRKEADGSTPWIGMGVSVSTNGSHKDHYVVRDGADWIETEVERTKGWHELKFDYSQEGVCQAFIDDVKVYEFKDAPYYNYVEFGDFWDHSGYPGDVSKMAFDDVKIGEPDIPENILSITFPEESVTVKMGETLQLRPIVETDPDVNAELIYASQEWEIAKVDEKTGVIQPVREGKTIVTVSSKKDPMINSTVAVEVTNAVDKAELDALYHELLQYVQSDYTQESWSVLEEKMFQAYAELQNKEATEETVATVLSALREAQAGLQLNFENRTNLTGENYGFEQGTLNGFGQYPAKTEEGISVEASTEAAYSGTYSAKVTTTDSIQKQPDGTGYDHKGLMYTILKEQLKEGVQYDISFKVRSGDDKKHKIGVRSVFRTEENTGTDESFRSEYVDVGQEWTQVSFRTPAVMENRDRIELIMGNENTTESAGVYYIDEVQIAEASAYIPTTDVALDQERVSVSVGKTVELHAVTTPENATSDFKLWSTSDENIATVENGNVTAKAAGTATITVTMLDGEHQGTCEVTVTTPEEPAELQSITIQEPQKKVYLVGEELDLIGLVVTAHYTDGSEKEVEAGNYEVTGFDSSTPGEKTVTVTFEGKSASFKVVVEKAVDKALLQETYDYARTLSTDGVIEDAKKFFENALAEAKAVLDNPNATQEEVEKALDTLLEGIWRLGMYQGDKANLKFLIEKAEAMLENAEKYVPEKWQQLLDALEKAKAVMNDGNAMEEDVEPAADALLNAILVQRYKADKSVLESLIREAKGIDPTEYTEKSVKALDKALENAKEIMEDENLSVDDQKKITKAETALRAALDGLEKRSEGGEDNNSDGDSNNGDNGNGDDNSGNNNGDQGQENTGNSDNGQTGNGNQNVSKGDSVKTGDTMSMMIPIAGIGVSVLVAVYVILVIKRKHH